jgi:hypothetical protein
MKKPTNVRTPGYDDTSSSVHRHGVSYPVDGGPSPDNTPFAYKTPKLASTLMQRSCFSEGVLTNGLSTNNNNNNNNNTDTSDTSMCKNTVSDAIETHTIGVESRGSRNHRRSFMFDGYCVHEIIEDLIDITPDHSKYVYYCEKCHECFDSLPQSKM